jgi:hypothetical protein
LNYRTNNSLVQTLNVNSLNELATATRSGTLTVAGTTAGAATNVTVNGLTASRYADNTFAKDGFTVANGTNSFTASAQDNYGRTGSDTGQPGRPGWGGKDHWHYWGGKEHLTEPLPPFKWLPSPVNGIDRVIAPPNTPLPPENISPPPPLAPFPPNFV